MTFKPEVIHFILSEVDRVEEYAQTWATHIPGESRFIARLLYYEPSVWEKKGGEKKPFLIVDADTSKSVLDSTKDVTVDTSKDGVIPFVLIIDGGDTKTKRGEVWQVSRERVTGDVLNPDFLAMADMIQSDRSTSKNKTILKAVNTPKQRVEALVRNWSRYALESPWVATDEVEYKDTLYFELAVPELRPQVDLDSLKALIA